MYFEENMHEGGFKVDEVARVQRTSSTTRAFKHIDWNGKWRSAEYWHSLSEDLSWVGSEQKSNVDFVVHKIETIYMYVKDIVLV